MVPTEMSKLNRYHEKGYGKGDYADRGGEVRPTRDTEGGEEISFPSKVAKEHHDNQ